MSKDRNIEMNDEKSVGDVMKKLLGNPKKLMGMIKKIGSRLEEKMQSENIDKKELMKEAMDAMKNMKNMPGMPDIGSLIQSMSGGGGGKTKLNLGQMMASMNRSQEMDSMKERMLKRMEERKKKHAEEMAKNGGENINLEGMENLVYSTGEKTEKSVLKPKSKTKTKNGKKGKKGKGKKKNKK